MPTATSMPATGIIQRTHATGFFLKFHQNSKLADSLFLPDPKYRDHEIEIIQVMMINDGYLLVECANVKNLDRI
jgi:hypothetical protein